MYEDLRGSLVETLHLLLPRSIFQVSPPRGLHIVTYHCLGVRITLYSQAHKAERSHYDTRNAAKEGPSNECRSDDTTQAYSPIGQANQLSQLYVVLSRASCTRRALGGGPYMANMPKRIRSGSWNRTRSHSLPLDTRVGPSQRGLTAPRC